MHIISHRALREFRERYPDSKMPLARWYKIIERSEFYNFALLRVAFPSVDLVGEWVIFNIGGNKYRLITSIHFNRGKVYIRYVLTHREYDRGDWRG